MTLSLIGWNEKTMLYIFIFFMTSSLSAFYDDGLILRQPITLDRQHCGNTCKINKSNSTAYAVQVEGNHLERLCDYSSANLTLKSRSKVFEYNFRDEVIRWQISKSTDVVFGNLFTLKSRSKSWRTTFAMANINIYKRHFLHL